MDKSLDVDKLKALLERCPHTCKDGPNCGFIDDRGRMCGKPEGEGRHIRYGPQVEYPGYHYFEPEQLHADDCPRCEALARLKG